MIIIFFSYVCSTLYLFLSNDTGKTVKEPATSEGIVPVSPRQTCRNGSRSLHQIFAQSPQRHFTNSATMDRPVSSFLVGNTRVLQRRSRNRGLEAGYSVTREEGFCMKSYHWHKSHEYILPPRGEDSGSWEFKLAARYTKPPHKMQPIFEYFARHH